MKAIQIKKPGELALIDKERPILEKSTEVIMQVKRVGICGSDLHVFEGENPFATYPRVWGHEFAGEIVEVGTDVTNVKIGDHVAGEPITYCGECYACRMGRGNICEKLQVYGVHADGACQEFVRIDSSHVYRLNDDISWDEAVLAEPFTIGAQVCYRTNLKKDDVMLIQGAGTIGLCILQLAKSCGAKVIITDLVDEKLEYAKSLGADYVINAGKEAVKVRVKEMTGGMGANVVADCVCIKSSFEDAVEIASAAGRIAVLGFGERPSEISQLLITKKELGIMGSRLQTGRFPIVIDLINHKKLNLDSFITHRYRIEETEEAFRYALANPGRYRKIVISF